MRPASYTAGGHGRKIARTERVAVGTSIAARPPHRSVGAALPHTDKHGTASILTTECRSWQAIDVPRIARVVAVGAPHHVTQRGNNRQQVFHSDSQRRSYLALLAEQAARHGPRVLDYCLMPNHVHAVVVPGRADSMAKGFGRAHNAYSRYFNSVRRPIQENHLRIKTL